MRQMLREYLAREVLGGRTGRFVLLKALVRRKVNEQADALFMVRCVTEFQRLGSHRFLRNYYRRKLIRRYGIFLGSGVRFGMGLRLPHPSSIISGESITFGADTVIYQQTTFGGRRRGEALETNYPTIGERCVFYAGCKVIGGIRVADGTVVGANAVLTRDTKPDGVYAGVPAVLRAGRGSGPQSPDRA